MAGTAGHRRTRCNYGGQRQVLVMLHPLSGLADWAGFQGWRAPGGVPSWRRSDLLA
jgi:hypothetical protein